MFSPVRMLKVNVLVLSKHVDELTRQLGNAGLVHLADAVHQSSHNLLKEVDVSENLERLEALSQKCGFLVRALGLERTAASAEDEQAPRSLDALRTRLNRIYKAFQEKDDRINELLSESGTLTRRFERLEKYPLRQVSISDLGDLDYVYFASGRLPPSQLDQATNQVGDRGLVLHQPAPNSTEEDVLIIAPRKNRWAIDSELKTLSFKPHDTGGDVAGTVDQELDCLNRKLADIRRAIHDHREELRAMADREGPWLLAADRQLRQGMALARAKQHFGQAADLFCISGWVPEERVGVVRDLVARVTGGTGVVEEVRPDDDTRVREGQEQVPVEFSRNRLLRPFQQIIAAFGAPRYNEVEASLFVALSFVLMFGVMFGDVGQGAVILLAGIYLLKTNRPSLGRFSDVGIMLALCGGSAMVFGFLYGSVFGYEGLLPHVWLSPLHDIMALFKAAVVIGIACITIGIGINIVNRLRRRDYLNGILDKFGVIGVVFYWGAIGLGLKAFVAGKLTGVEIFLVILLPLIVLFLREPLYHLVRRDKHLLDEDVFSYAMHAAVDVMETITMFLGSTVSFIRVGAFALSHAGLCLAIYVIAGTLTDLPGGGVWAFLVILVGNVFVILLEGLIVSIQGVRLQYYELFSKYFPGDGVLYKPFSIRENE